MNDFEPTVSDESPNKRVGTECLRASMNKLGYDIRMVRNVEIPDMLKFRNARFGDISREQWEAMGCTAVVARKGGEIHGAIPLQYRQFKINSRVSVPMVCENAVGVAEKSRSLGLGSAMLDVAERALRGRVDAFYVYRGEERSPGYRFYRKTNHGDLYYKCNLALMRPKGENNKVEVLNASAAVALERDLLPVFANCYGGFGGYWNRDQGYFRQILDSHVYKNEDWKLFLLRKGKAILGYAITNPHDPITAGFCIYDFAAPGIAARQALLTKIEWVAGRNKQPVTMMANREHPLFQPLLKRGYAYEEQSPFGMARIIRPDRIFARLAHNSMLLQNLHLDARTPHRDLVLNRPAKPKYKATLYLKESHLTRLLSCRLDMVGALETNMIRMTPLPARVENALCSVLRFCPWVLFEMDFV